MEHYQKEIDLNTITSIAHEESLVTKAPDLSNFEKIHEIISGRAYSAAVYVAAKLGIADLLVDRSEATEELAKKLNVDERSLYRLMRALASIGIFEELAEKNFRMTVLASTLRSDIPNSIRDLAIMCGSDWHWQTWGGLIYTVRTGKPFFSEHFGQEFFPYIKKNEETEKEFNAGMTSLSSLTNYAIADQYNFSNIKVVVDIGGGHGGLLQAILKLHRKVEGILYDLPSVAEAAKSLWGNDETSHRVKIEGGDFFSAIPSGGDIYILKHVLHGLDNEQSSRLLKNIASAIPKDGKLLIIEMIIPGMNMPSYSKFNDLGMMLLSGSGQERQHHEFEQIISSSGLTMKHVLPAHFGICIIEAMKE